MSEFSEYNDSMDVEGAPVSCYCRHCRSEGYYSQDADCRYYFRPAAPEPPPLTFNYARRYVP